MMLMMPLVIQTIADDDKRQDRKGVNFPWVCNWLLISGMLPILQ